MGRQPRGFSLIEVLVAMAVSSILITAIYQLFHNQRDSYLLQDQVAEMQQNLRSGLYLLTKELRSAGYDPLRTGLFGFVTDFAAPNQIFNPDINYATDKSTIAFTIDDNEDGVRDKNDAEQIAYRLNTSTNALERYSASNSAWQVVATNVDALDFVYLDTAGAVTTNPANIRAVQITMLVRTGEKDREYKNPHTYLNKQGQNICTSCTNDQYYRRLLSTTIHIRN
jgi:type IV pilus assembly protein PilW